MKIVTIKHLPSWICTGFLALSVFSCDVPASFGPEYDNTATNFIAAFALAEPPAASDQGTSVSLDSPARWDWAWRGTMGNSFEYMTLTQLADGTGPGSAGSGWRLESVNLAASAYQEDIVLQPAWKALGTGSVALENTPGAHGQRVALTSIATNWAGLDPSLFFSDVPQANCLFTLRGFISTSLAKIYYQVENSTTVNWETPPFVSPTAENLIAIENFSVLTADTRLMFAQLGLTQTLALDDLRVVRVDKADAMKLRLLLRPSDTSPGLVPGYHEFTIWARVPSDALKASDPLRVSLPTAAFSTYTVTLSMKQIGFLDLRDSPSIVKEEFTVTGDWTQFVLRMPQDSNFERFDETSVDPVIELAIQPFSNGKPDVSAIEIASPELHFYKNGY